MFFNAFTSILFGGSTENAQKPAETKQVPKEDYYAILEVSSDASDLEIKKAFRELGLKYHPDKNPEGTEKFLKIRDAYEILGDPEKRKKYDTTSR